MFRIRMHSGASSLATPRAATIGCKEHPDPCSPDALASLEAIAHIAKIGIPHIEARHASLRRVKNSRSSTWSINIQNLSSYFTLLRARIDAQGTFPTILVLKKRGRPRKTCASKWEKRMGTKEGRSRHSRKFVVEKRLS